jgi:hypothetical protein
MYVRCVVVRVDVSAVYHLTPLQPGVIAPADGTQPALVIDRRTLVLAAHE